MNNLSINTLCQFFLKFGSPSIVIFFIIIGYILYNRQLFSKTTVLLLLATFVNILLKITFKVPLPAHLDKNWFAFPSGHMQFATVMYGYIAYKIPNFTLRFSILILLTLMGVSLVQQGYHHYFDVIGGAVVGVILIFIYELVNKNYANEFKILILPIATFFMFSIYLIHHGLPLHAIQFYSILVGFVLAEKYVNKYDFVIYHKSLYIKIFTTILTMLLVYLIAKILDNLHFDKIYTQSLKGLSIGSVIPLATYLVPKASKLLLNNHFISTSR